MRGLGALVIKFAVYRSARNIDGFGWFFLAIGGWPRTPLPDTETGRPRATADMTIRLSRADQNRSLNSDIMLSARAGKPVRKDGFSRFLPAARQLAR